MNEPVRASRILVVEDDQNVADVVTRYLEREGYEVETVSDGRAAIDRATTAPPDLMVLDLMLPGADGVEVLRRVRAVGAVPVIMLTARGEEDDRVAGLELGADDYLGKPFSPRELTARVRSVLRRTAGIPPADDAGLVEAGELVLDLKSREARLGQRDVPLTALEFELLSFLMLHPNRAFRRDQLLERVWGYRFGDTSTVTVHVRRIREKIEPDPASPRFIKTVWGVGYRFEP